VRHFLSYLYLGDPEVWCVRLLAIFALLIFDLELDDQIFAKLDFVEHFALDGGLDFEAARVRLCPDKTTIDNLSAFWQAADMFEAHCKHLRRFGLAKGPTTGSSPPPPITLFAVQKWVRLYSFGYVDLASEALHARV
jgi:hypothetical protein